MITGIYEGQTLWYNNITFTNSGAPRSKYKVEPTLCSVSNISSDPYWVNFYLTPLTSDPDIMFRICVNTTNGKEGLITYNNNIHTTWKESVKAYNEKIDKKIQWYRGQLEEGQFNSYCQEPFSLSSSEYPLDLNNDPGPINLTSILLTAGKTVSGGGSRKVGYVLLGSKRYGGISVPWYPWEVNGITAISGSNELILSLGYYKSMTVGCESYGTSIYTSIYETKRDLLVDCLNGFDELIGNISEQVDKKIKKLEKLKIRI